MPLENRNSKPSPTNQNAKTQRLRKISHTQNIIEKKKIHKHHHKMYSYITQNKKMAKLPTPTSTDCSFKFKPVGKFSFATGVTTLKIIFRHHLPLIHTNVRKYALLLLFSENML